MSNDNPTLLSLNSRMKKSGREANQARPVLCAQGSISRLPLELSKSFELNTQTLPQDLLFGFNPRVPPPPLYQDVWNLNCVPLPFDSNQDGAPAPIREHGKSPALGTIVGLDTNSQQSARNASNPNFLLPGINPLPGIEVLSRINGPLLEPVYFYKPRKDQYENFNEYIHAPPKAYRHTFLPAPKIPKFGTPLSPRQPYIEPQYDVTEEPHTQSIVEILFPESRSFWNTGAQAPKPKVPEFVASLSPRQEHDGEPQDNAPRVDEPPSQDIAQGLPNGDSEETEQLTRSDSKKKQYRCSNCKKFTKKIVGKKTKEPEYWICRICYFKDYNKKRPRYRTSTK